ncbi:hypothetical protein EG328_006264 [Venturia inaequalis]|uniref:Uncharacterized protein n=1 Tax=Venturia inaequalis TaxID=5025 RepID=A0A8H3ZBG1_VENIN|nr:hypothetical protein EG328_006264 [Venturia inaequalis]RDI79900.1 hypothetical protein Vi05172_g10170 [Venturia inaequalis]
MDRRSNQNPPPRNAARREHAIHPQQLQYNGPPIRHPNDLTYTPNEDPFPLGPHTLTRAIRLLDSEDMPTHIFFLLDRNMSPEAETLLRQVVATANNRREQIGGDVIAVAKASLTSNRPALVKVRNTNWGELFVTSVGREDLASVMWEVDPEVWRLCGVGTSISEGRMYLLRNARGEGAE